MALSIQMSGPEAVFHWKDTLSTGAEGWVVWDRIINGVAGGGIFMHATATQKETEDIARNMSRKV
jgi:glutamate dehydrogenase (NAD(P)+)